MIIGEGRNVRRNQMGMRNAKYFLIADKDLLQNLCSGCQWDNVCTAFNIDIVLYILNLDDE